MAFSSSISNKINTIKDFERFPHPVDIEGYFNELNALRRLFQITTDEDEDYRNYDDKYKKYLDKINNVAHKVYLTAKDVRDEKIIMSFFDQENKELHSKATKYLKSIEDLNSFLITVENDKFSILKDLVRECFDDLRIFTDHYLLLVVDADKHTKKETTSIG